MRLVWAGRVLAVIAILGLTVVTTTADEGNLSAKAKLTGFQENLPKLTDGTGTFEATIKGGMLSYKLTYSGLSSDAFMSHIHFGQPTVNGGVFLWLCGSATAPGRAGRHPNLPRQGRHGVRNRIEHRNPVAAGHAEPERRRLCRRLADPSER